MTVSRELVIQLLQYCKATKYGIESNREIWTKGNVIIRLSTSGGMDYDDVEEIALEQLGMNMWDFDYWLGQNRIELDIIRLEKEN